MSSISSKVQAAVDKLCVAAGDLVLNATLTNTVAGAYDVATGTGSSVSTVVPLGVIIDKYSAMDLMNTNIRATDVKLIAFNEGTEPIVGSKIVVKSETLTVIAISEVRVGEHVPIFELQCRK